MSKKSKTWASWEKMPDGYWVQITVDGERSTDRYTKPRLPSTMHVNCTHTLKIDGQACPWCGWREGDEPEAAGKVQESPSAPDLEGLLHPVGEGILPRGPYLDDESEVVPDVDDVDRRRPAPAKRARRDEETAPWLTGF